MDSEEKMIHGFPHTAKYDRKENWTSLLKLFQRRGTDGSSGDVSKTV